MFASSVWLVGNGSKRGGSVSCTVTEKKVEFLLLLVSLMVRLNLYVPRARMAVRLVMPPVELMLNALSLRP